MARVRRVGSVAAITLTITLVAALGAPVAAHATPGLSTLGSDTFRDATTASPNWMKPSGSNVACLTASSNTSQMPIPGCDDTTDASGSGALRLTTTADTQVGTVYSTVSLPTAKGLSITFNSYQYGDPSRADGISFILAATDPANPSAPTNVGPSGGSLGYAASLAGAPGVAHGYLGFGLDVYGNFVNGNSVGTDECLGSDASAPGEVKDSIGVRGPGNGNSGYCLLARDSVGDQGLDQPDSSIRPAAVPVEIGLNPSDTAAVTAGGLTVAAHSWAMRVGSYNGSSTLTGALPSMSGYADSSWLDASGVPYQLTFGWAGSTGGSTEVHEINALAAETVTGKLPVYTLSASDNESGSFLAGDQAVVSVTPTLSASEGDEAATATTTTTFPTGILPQSGTFTTNGHTCTTSGQVVTCTYTPGTTLTAGSSLPTAAIPVTIASGTAAGNYTISFKVSSTDANPATTTRTVAVSHFSASASGTISYGANETLTAAGLPAGATGSVTFTDADGAVLCTVTDLTAGTSCVVTSPVTGSYAVTATYSPDVSSPYSGHTATTSFTVSKAAAPFTAEATPSTVDFATTSTLSATGLPAGSTGTVTFTDTDHNVICVATLPTTSCSTPASLPVGTHPFTATYSGDGNHTGSTAATGVTVHRSTPTLSAAVTDPSINYGATTTLSYSGLTLTGATAATGTVTFADGDGHNLCTATLPDASCATSASLPVGSYGITATYSGDSNHVGVAATPVDLEVTKAPTTLTAGAASGDVAFSDTDTLSYAGLTLTGATAATGTVTFTDADGHTLCTATLPDTSCSTSDSLPAGTYHVTATYSGDSNHDGSTAATFTLKVSPAGTAGMTAAATPASTPFADADTLSYSGLPLSGSTAATGTVTFTDADGHTLCTATLPDTSCQAPADLSVGTYDVTATYSGDTNHDGTTATAGFAVTKADTTITATPASASIVYGAAETLSYSGLQLSGSTAATGTVTFTDADGHTLCTATLPDTSCQAPAALPVDSYTVTATYSGDSNHTGTTATTSFAVTKADTTVGLAPASGTYGTPTALTATGLPTDATGTVTFADSDDTVLCTATLPETSCKAPAHLSAGTHTVTVRYSGGTNYSRSSASADVAIAKRAFAVTATVSVPIATLGQLSTLTVAGIPADATGTIQVTSNGAVLCTITLPATACTLSGTLPVGDHPLTVAYAGDGNNDPATTTTAFAVIAVPRTEVSVTTPPGSDGTITTPVPSDPGVTVTIVDGPHHGTAQIVDGKLIYTPDDGYSGTDTVTYQVTYPDGRSELVTVTFTVPAQADDRDLAYTGAAVGPLLGLTVGLVAAGVALLLASRTRRRA